ncbi:cobyrinate a,c-diamide synthase [Anaerosacchariphilus polymeriproducens]|uniref:Cobyrinate a,c-diamide synthase n=1 Tax=Anaerosacchariphilus polymeriproducens TaxID=1812858 RepID=A0A371AY72_9FIRM|nr:cobyrinate a,c-diamide synthase [Anaerosacchariphilus polymeriproducens]RDU24538.1 cobyrinate a,c-diamide synthase [Anaerosacchariphilus polymeriproducens]
MKVPRVLITAGASGNGKTMITCGILQALVNRGLKTGSFKCGPDYIDPIFHSRVIKTKSRNLDSFLSKPETVRDILAMNGSQCDISVLEGVMGYYDGLGGTHTQASTYDIATITETPVILIVNCKGLSLSAAAYVQGFLHFKNDSNIKGVILNQLPEVLYKSMKDLIEEAVGVEVYGYVPNIEDFQLESRHLGLILPDEIKDIQEKLNELGGLFEHTLDIDSILSLADSAPELEQPTEIKIENKLRRSLRIGVAKDEAFCFLYEDNLKYLKDHGVEIVEFSPIHDKVLPSNLQGLILHGGYPELYVLQLSENQSMKESIYHALNNRMPCIAECGGFMYLHQWLEDKDGKDYPMVGIIEGRTHYTNKLSHFGYITLSQGKVFGKEVGELKAHEFHYYESTECGESFLAQKSYSSRSWRCIHSTDTLLAGFPHHYFYGNSRLAEAFLEVCENET